MWAQEGDGLSPREKETVTFLSGGCSGRPTGNWIQSPGQVSSGRLMTYNGVSLRPSTNLHSRDSVLPGRSVTQRTFRILSKPSDGSMDRARARRNYVCGQILDPGSSDGLKAGENESNPVHIDGRDSLFGVAHAWNGAGSRDEMQLYVSFCLLSKRL